MPRKVSRNIKRIQVYRKAKRNMPLTKRQVKAVKKIAAQSGEVKYRDVAFDDNDIYNGFPATLSTLLTIAQGDSVSQREGDKLLLKNIRWRGYLESKDTNQSQVVRMLMYQTTDGAANVAELNSIKPDDFLPRGDATNQRYKILLDKTLTLNCNGSPCKKFFNFSINNMKKQISYEAASSNVSSGYIYCQIVPDENVPTGDLELFSNLRVLWTDN